MDDQLYTTSRVKSHARCPRLHHLQYDLGIQTESSAAAAFGTAGHTALEAWYGALADGDQHACLSAALATIDTSPLDAFDRAKLRVLVRGYDARWFDEFVDEYDNYLFDVLGVEVQFRYDLGGRIIGGKLDVLVRRLADRAIFVIEHKFTGSAIGDGEAYWERLAIDTQCSIYLDGASVLTGEPVSGVIYDVIGKPGQKPFKATPVEKQTFTIGKGCKLCGGKKGEKGTGKMRAPNATLTFTDAPCSVCRGTGWAEAPRLHADQRARIENGLRAAVRADRIHRVRGIAHQRDIAEGPAVDGIAVHQRVFIGLRGRADQARHVEPVEMPVLEPRQEFLELGCAVVVLAPPVMLRREVTLGDPVDAALAVR